MPPYWSRLPSHSGVSWQATPAQRKNLLVASGYFLACRLPGDVLANAGLSLPTPSGPHAIGTDTRVWTRQEMPGIPASENQARKIVVQFWYPAAQGAIGPVAPYRDADAGTLLSKYLQW